MWQSQSAQNNPSFEVVYGSRKGLEASRDIHIWVWKVEKWILEGLSGFQMALSARSNLKIVFKHCTPNNQKARFDFKDGFQVPICDIDRGTHHNLTLP